MKGKELRIVFMGTPEFACESLKALIENGYNTVAVITVPDKPAGRGQKLNQSAVKQYALGKGLPILQPVKLKDEEFISELRSFKADLQVIVAFRMLPEIVWSMPPMGTINLHGSLLPNYRGAAPLNWPIINGDKETGLTTFLLKQEIDTGNILFQERIKIGPDDTVGDLHDRSMKLGAGLLLKTIDALAEGSVKPVSQDSLEIDPNKLHAPKIFKEDCRIDWRKTGNQIRNLVRGLSPYPAAWTVLKKDDTSLNLKIFSSSFEPDMKSFIPGTIQSDQKHYLKIACLDGFINVEELQLAGKTKMKTVDFLRGFPNIGDYKVE
jgi:methionyl-tRNA formyltransferase